MRIGSYKIQPCCDICKENKPWIYSVEDKKGFMWVICRTCLGNIIKFLGREGVKVKGSLE